MFDQIFGARFSSGDISNVYDSKCSRIEFLERTPNRMGHNTNDIHDICTDAGYNVNVNCMMCMNNTIHNNSTNLNTFSHFSVSLSLSLSCFLCLFVCLFGIHPHDKVINAHTHERTTKMCSVFILFFTFQKIKMMFVVFLFYFRL